MKIIIVVQPKKMAPDDVTFDKTYWVAYNMLASSHVR